MRTTAHGLAERRTPRLPADDLRSPVASFPHRELAAGLASFVVVAQLALAPVTLVIAAVLTLTGRISRWRLNWLLLPAVAGTGWLAAVRVTVAVPAFVAGSGTLIAAELAVARHPGWLLHPVSQLGAAPLAGAGWWLPRELPLTLLAGTIEAAIVLWIIRRRSPAAWRPGAIAVVRRRAAAAALASSHTVTAGGCAIGINPSSGRRAGFTWAEARRGVLLTGPDDEQLRQLGLAVVCAAMRMRKTVIIIESSAGLAGQVALVAGRLGVPVTEISALDGDAAGSMGRAIRSRRILVVSACQPELTRRALGDLAGVLAGLRDLGLRGDCLACVTGCDRIEPEVMAGLLELGQATGTCVLLSTTNMTCAASLTGRMGTTVERGRTATPGAFTLIRHSSDARTSGVLVPLALAKTR
jgi:hypothetical protein